MPQNTQQLLQPPRGEPKPTAVSLLPCSSPGLGQVGMLWHMGTRSYRVLIALRAQGQVNCCDGDPRTSRSWRVWIAGTHTGNFSTSNPVSLGPRLPGQAGSGPGFQKLFSALMGGSLAFRGELSSRGSPLLVHRDILVPQDYRSWCSPQSRPPHSAFHLPLADPWNRFPKSPGLYYQMEKELKFTEHLLDNSHCTLYPMYIILFNPEVIATTASDVELSPFCR